MMKTSNKLLIALAAALIIIPILTIAINVKMNYVDAKTWMAEAKMEDHFKSVSPGMAALKIGQPFSKIQIDGNEHLYLEVRIVKDENTGLKVEDAWKDRIIFNVDATGTLKISFKNLPKEQNRSFSLLIYAPNPVTDLDANTVNGIRINSGSDSLHLNFKNIRDVALRGNDKLGKLNVVMDGVQDFSLPDEFGGSLTLDLNNSVFNSQENSFKNLIIKSTGKSSILISGDEKEKARYEIENLSIKTVGEAAVTLENIKVGSYLIDLSDETLVVMPMVYLRHMTNK